MSMPPRTEGRPAPRGVPRSVGRVMGILEALSEHNSRIGLAELAVRLRAPKTSLVGLLAGLTADGFLVRDRSGRYALGGRFLTLAAKVLSGRELTALMRPVLTRLAEEAGETAILAGPTQDADMVTFLDRVECANPIRYAVTVGEQRELHSNAAGKCLLAHLGDRRIRSYLETVERRAYTPNTLTDAEALLAELRQIRETGLSRSVGERYLDSTGMAVPVTGPDGHLAAILLVAGPSDRVAQRAGEIEALLRDAGRQGTILAGADPARADEARDPV